MAVTTIYEWEVQILDCAFDAVNPLREIKRKLVTIGEIVWDNCECGQLAISENRRFPSMSFPLDEIDHQAACGSPWLVSDLTLSLARCMPVGNQRPPTPEALSSAAYQLDLEIAALRRAVECCLDEAYNSHELQAYQIGGTTIIGPQGACVAADTQILIGASNGCGCSS